MNFLLMTSLCTEKKIIARNSHIALHHLWLIYLNSGFGVEVQCCFPIKFDEKTKRIRQLAKEFINL